MNRRPVGDLPGPYRHASHDLRHRASGTAPAPASATTPTAPRRPQ
ncbi:hypothetical protein ACFW5S_10220 [Streptomyces olivaceus]